MKLKHTLLWIFGGFFGALTWAAGPQNLDANGVAVKGYDAVAYFSENRPVKGTAEFSTKLDGATYLFASAANRDKFIANPTKYQPQYGGYCAYGVAQGYKPDIDPNAFSVVDGKLFLNFSPVVTKRWEQDIPGYIKTGNEKWKTLVSQ